MRFRQRLERGELRPGDAEQRTHRPCIEVEPRCNRRLVQSVVVQRQRQSVRRSEELDRRRSVHHGRASADSGAGARVVGTCFSYYPHPVGPWPLVGRSEELVYVVETIRGERSRGVVVAGELGVGKSRLARAAINELEAEFASEWVAGTAASAQIPFGAVAHLVDDDAIATPEDRLVVARSIASRLAERAGGRRLILAVDDAQWLDAGTATLVHQLLVAERVKVLLTLRADEPVPDTIVACWKDGWVERLEVQPLNALNVAEVVRSVVGHAVDPLTLQRFWSLSNGNALFLHELLLVALETGAYTVADGVWTWTGGATTSTRLRPILESRFSRLTPPGRAVLDALAVGEPLPLDTLIGLYGPDAVIDVEQCGLATVEERHDHVRLAHPIYGEAVRRAMGAVARRRLMAQLAEAVGEAADLAPGERLRTAVWRLESGSAVAPALLAEGAQIANAMYDHVLAERMARSALAAGAGLATARTLGDALNRQGRCDEGLAVLEPLATQASTDEEHVGIAISRYFGLTTAYGFRPEFASVLLDAEERVTDPRLVAYLQATRATLLTSAGLLEEGVALALATLQGEPDEVTQLRAVSPLAGAWLCAGRAESACALTERMLDVAFLHRHEAPQAPGWVMSLHLPSLVVAGRLDDADAATELVETLMSTGVPSADVSALIALARGMSNLQRGLVRTAADLFRQSVALLRPIARWRLPFALAQLAEASALLGDADAAAAASDEADVLVEHHAIFEGLARRARGWVALARGQRSVALDRWFQAAAWSAEHGQHTAELLSLHDAARYGGAQQVLQRLEVVASTAEDRWAPCFVAHARALVSGDGEALEGAATKFEQAGALLLAAEAFANASFAFRSAESRSRAERAAARAFRLASRCEQPCSPVLEELERPLPLTRREREVAKLAATGLSSQTIASRLFLSVRTVEGHLQNAYGKLGVNDRQGLSTALGVGRADRDPG